MPRLTPTIYFVVNNGEFFLSHRLELALEAKRRGYRAAVICPRDKSTQTIADHGIEHVELAMPRGRGGIIAEISAALSLYRLLCDDRPTLLHLVTAKPIIVGGVIARLLGIPVVAAVSGLGHIFIERSATAALMRRLLLLGYRAALARRDAIAIFQNCDDRARLGHACSNAVLIPGSGTDLERFDPCPPDNARPVVALPARMLWTKGVREFADAARLLRRRRLSADFLLVGDPDPGNPASVPVDVLEAWSAEGVVQWQPHRADIETVLRGCDIVVLPSYREGFPKTLIDAAAAGRPVVTTNVPGCRDAVLPGESGLLARPGDAEDLADKIAKLLGDGDTCRRMGQAGRRLAERSFGVGRVVAAHFDVYERLINSCEGPA